MLKVDNPSEEMSVKMIIIAMVLSIGPSELFDMADNRSDRDAIVAMLRKA